MSSPPFFNAIDPFNTRSLSQEEEEEEAGT
jgi:hypothetical protein